MINFARILPPIIGTMVLGINMTYGQEYPNKTIRIVTSIPGGGNDFSARVIAQAITGSLGQTVIVENRAGIMGIETVAKATPDGYTVLLHSDSCWILPFFLTVSYDPVRDFAPISLTGRTPTILVVNPSVAANSVKDLIALAKAKPGELNYGSASLGSATHIGAELFKSMAGVNIVSIQYKGSAPAINDLIGGQLQVMFAVASSVKQHVSSGRLRALAVSSAEPSPLAPGLPTVASSGLPGFQSASTQGVWVPAKTPAKIIARLHQEIVRAINRSDVKERFFVAGVETVGTTPEQFSAYINNDRVVVAKLLKSGGVHAK